jgi:hypothetical protein
MTDIDLGLRLEGSGFAAVAGELLGRLRAGAGLDGYAGQAHALTSAIAAAAALGGAPTVETAWTPAALASAPVAWWDASDTGTISHVAGSVTQIDDKSGSGYHLTQGTGSLQPTTGTRTQNGLNALDFDGTERMTVSSVTWPDTFHLFQVAEVDAVDDINDTLLAVDDGSTFRLNMFRAGDATEFRAQVTGPAGGGTALLQASDFAAAPHIFETWFDGGASPNTHALVIDATELDAEADYPGSGATGCTVDLFSHLIDTANPDGGFFELVVTDAVVAGGDLTDLRTYLNDRWGIS